MSTDTTSIETPAIGSDNRAIYSPTMSADEAYKAYQDSGDLPGYQQWAQQASSNPATATPPQVVNNPNPQPATLASLAADQKRNPNNKLLNPTTPVPAAPPVAAPVAALPAAKPVAPKAATGSAGSNPYRTELKEDEGIRADQAKNLQTYADSLQANKELLLGKDVVIPSTTPGVPDQVVHSGGAIDEGIKQTKVAQANDWAAQSQIEAISRKAESEANLRGIEIDKQAAEQRAADAHPQNWYQKAGTAKSIGAAIAIGAGAFAAAMPHTNTKQNFALDIINKAVDDDAAQSKLKSEDAWKAIQFNVSEDHRKYVKDQFVLNRMNEAKLTNWNHAMAQIADARQATNDKVAASNLDQLSLQVKEKINDLQMQNAAQRRDVGVKEMAAGVAGAARVQEIRTFRDQRTQDYISKFQMSPEQAQQMAENDTSRKYGGPSTQAASTDITPTRAQALKGTAGAEFGQGLSELQPLYDEVAKNNPLFGITPNSNDSNAVRTRDQLNARIIAAWHAASPGIRSPELIKETTKPFLITSLDNKETIAKKQVAFTKALNDQHMLQGKPTPTTNVPDEASGITPVESE